MSETQYIDFLNEMLEKISRLLDDEEIFCNLTIDEVIKLFKLQIEIAEKLYEI